MFARQLALAMMMQLICGCAACSDTSAPDSGTQPEAGRETGTVDAQPPCNGSDITSDWAGFRRLTELSPCCIVDVALDAGASLPSLSWSACANVPNCQEVRAPSSGSVLPGTVSRDGIGAPALLPLTFWVSGTEWMIGLYSVPSQAVVSGFRANTGVDAGSQALCPFNPLAAGTGVALLARAGAGGPILAAHAPSTASTFSFRILSPAKAIAGFQYSGASVTRLAFDVPGPVEQWAFDSGTLVGSQNATGATLNFDFVASDDVYAYSPHGTTGWYSEYRVAVDGSTSLFRGTSGRHIYAMASDGATLAWCEAYGAATPVWVQPTVELWTAPYTNSPTQLAATAKKLVTLPGAAWCGGGTAFQGYYVTHTTTGFDVATVVRLSDGASQQVSAGSGRAFGVIALVSQTEVWSGIDQSLGDAGLGLGGIAFARYELGAWP